VALPGLAQTANPSSPTQGRYAISVNVDLVVLNVTVEDRNGSSVSGLHREDFHVYENGIAQKITLFLHEDRPVTVGLVLDNSGSMRPERAQVIAAALAFARSSNPADEMFVVHFNENVTMGLPPKEPFTSDAGQLRAALAGISSSGRTALYDAIAAGLENLARGSRKKKVLMVVTDGGDNASTHNFSQILKMAQQSDAIIYPIGLFNEYDRDRKPRVLKKLASNTGGEAFFPDRVQEATRICEQIARDIRSQYTIGYVPTNQRHDGTYRAVQVIVSAPGHRKLSVRTRAGYRAPREESARPPAKRSGTP
jgi:VWFA-related protein